MVGEIYRIVKVKDIYGEEVPVTVRVEYDIEFDKKGNAYPLVDLEGVSVQPGIGNKPRVYDENLMAKIERQYREFLTDEAIVDARLQEKL